MSAKRPEQPTTRYMIADLLAAAEQQFKVPRDVAAAALSGLGPLTIAEALAVVNRFVTPNAQDTPEAQAAPASNDKAVEGGKDK